MCHNKAHSINFYNNWHRICSKMNKITYKITKYALLFCFFEKIIVTLQVLLFFYKNSVDKMVKKNDFIEYDY